MIINAKKFQAIILDKIDLSYQLKIDNIEIKCGKSLKLAGTAIDDRLK